MGLWHQNEVERTKPDDVFLNLRLFQVLQLRSKMLSSRGSFVEAFINAGSKIDGMATRTHRFVDGEEKTVVDRLSYRISNSKDRLDFYEELVVENDIDLVILAMSTGCNFKDRRQPVIALANLLGSSTLLDELPFAFSSANGTSRLAKRMLRREGCWPHEVKELGPQVSATLVMKRFEADAAHKPHQDFYLWVAEHYGFAFCKE